METTENAVLSDEIKKLEKELYLKKSILAAKAAKEKSDAGILETYTPKDSPSVLHKIIDKIGEYSKGGDSVQDVWVERKR